nr:immunoglobulin light chain junction region [Macaca mulatta]MOX47937.1 immunoglobulin light chain junction region [Macaca mulatta]MOX48007.1 immunoglobulin light chain junction region [Macaca mulatta]MOX48251.1 immunoglobulin light chain junction region [Macaca mulatta]MOX48323.1 immunoglobulin light chain junction region [Macaca mulatta]
CQQGYDTPPTF